MFMEKGRPLRRSDPDLLEQPDILRAVFLDGADAATPATPASSAEVDLTFDPSTPPPFAGPPQHQRKQRRRPRRRSRHRPHRTARPHGPGPRMPRRDETLRWRDCGRQRRPHRPPGTILGLVGQNGAGKTTLLDCISGSTASTPAAWCCARRRDGLGAVGTGPRAHGPVVPGGPTVPVAHRRRDGRRRLRAQRAEPFDGCRRTAPAGELRGRARHSGPSTRSSTS